MLVAGGHIGRLVVAEQRNGLHCEPEGAATVLEGVDGAGGFASRR